MPSAQTRRLLFWTPAVVGGAVIVALMFRPVAVPVDFVEVVRGSIEVSVSDEGKTRVKDVFVVSAPVPGLMRRIELEAGDPVSAGETVVARIEPSDPSFLDARTQAEARAAVRAAEAAENLQAATVRRAEAELEFAEAEYRRFEGLAESGTVSDNELDSALRRARTAAAVLDETRASLKARGAELEQTRARLINPNSDRAVAGEDCECVNAYSPVSGTVLQVLKKSEGVVASGMPLIEVGDPRRLEVVVDLLSTDAVRVEAGQLALIEAWGGEVALEGVVTRVEPFGYTKLSALGIEEQRVNVRIDLSAPPDVWVRLGHGYRVEPRIVLAEAADVLKVPRSALFRDGASWAVFVEEANTALLRPVELGLQNDLEAEVSSGLQIGDRVVVQPGDRVTDGARLQDRG
jgi:HlyD family secretion protein